MKPALLLVVSMAVSAVAAAQSFTPTGSMLAARTGHTATVLQDGRVFVAGGASDASCEIYDPSTRTFRATAAMTHSRAVHTATLLKDGRVLIAGGIASGGDLSGGNEIDVTAQIYDPAGETFTLAGRMTTPRYAHAATLLTDGRVLLTGGGEVYISGFGTGIRAQAHAEVYDPATNSFSTVPDMRMPRWYHTASLLTDGTVLLVGAPQGSLSGLPSAEVFDPQAKTFRDIPGARRRMSHTATTLKDGRVLLAGGNSLVDSNAEVYAPSAGTFTPVTSTTTSSSHSATLLPDGRVLMTGWTSTGQSTDAAAIYDPASNQLALTASMAFLRSNGAAAALAGGPVLVTGGTNSTAEIFEAAPVAPAAGRRRSSRH